MMTPIVFAPFVGGLAEIALYVVLAQFASSPIRALVPAFLVGGLAGAGLFSLGAGSVETVDAIGYALLGALAFLATTFCFWAVINLNATAIRVRVLREIWRAPDRTMSVEALDRRYAIGEIFERRLERLALAGYVAEDGAQVRLAKGSIALVADLVGFARWLIMPAEAASKDERSSQD